MCGALTLTTLLRRGKRRRPVQAGLVALLLGCVHGAVGSLDQADGSVGMFREQSDADAWGDKVDAQGTDGNRFTQLRENPLGQGVGGCGRATWHEQGEFIATQ